MTIEIRPNGEITCTGGAGLIYSEQTAEGGILLHLDDVDQVDEDERWELTTAALQSEETSRSLLGERGGR